MNEQLKKLLKQLNLKPEDAAKKLGLSTDALNKILSGVSKLDASDFEKYAKKLGVKPEEILKDLKNKDLGKVAKDLSKVDTKDLSKLASGFLKK